MSTQVERGEFTLIISEVDANRLDDATRQFARAFSLDEVIAAQILKSAPIIFASDLTKKEVKAVTGVLKEISKTGIEFRVTARLAKKIPKVNWPIRPQFTAGGSGAANGLSFRWDNNAFVCPSCGETFLFRRLGVLPLLEPPAESAPAAASASSSSSGTQSSVRPAVAKMEAKRTAPAPAADSGPLEIAGEPEQIDLSDSPGEMSLPDESPGGPVEMPDLPEEASLDLPQEEEGGSSLEVPEEAPAGGDGDGELYNVFLSKIADSSKRTKAAELIAKVKGCAPAEAKELSTRLVIPLAKDVSKGHAEKILEEFKKLKIFGRMTKAK